MVPRRRRPDEDDSEISVTPMLDIVFIMLIFFVVTTSFVKEPGIDPQRPQAHTATTNERGNILVGVSSADSIWMNKKRLAITEVRPLVEAAIAENPESSVVIVADQQATVGLVIDLMDEARAAGITNISLSAEPEE